MHETTTSQAIPPRDSRAKPRPQCKACSKERRDLAQHQDDSGPHGATPGNGKRDGNDEARLHRESARLREDVAAHIRGNEHALALRLGGRNPCACPNASSASVSYLRVQALKAHVCLVIIAREPRASRPPMCTRFNDPTVLHMRDVLALVGDQLEDHPRDGSPHSQVIRGAFAGGSRGPTEQAEHARFVDQPHGEEAAAAEQLNRKTARARERAPNGPRGLPRRAV